MKIVKIIIGIGVLFLLFSCEKEQVKMPKAEATINKELLTINESMIISFTGIADQVVVYPGDDMHDYNLRDQSNTGLVVDKNLFTYSYAVPGVYKVVCLASTSGDLATNLKFDTCSFTVTVIDDVTEIDRLSCPQVIRDEVFASKQANDEWLMVLPRKVLYNNRPQNVSITSQRLKFYIQSDSTKVFVNGSEFVATTGYNLSAPVDISVKSNYGTNRPYKLYTINYPEFATFKLSGVDGVETLNIYDYSAYIWNVTLPSGTDASNLAPEFTTFSTAEKVYIGNTEQSSGVSKVDFTKPVTYRLVSTLPDKPGMQAESKVIVNVSFK